MPRVRPAPASAPAPEPTLSLSPPPRLRRNALHLLALAALAAALAPGAALPAPRSQPLTYDPIAGLSRAEWHYVDPATPSAEPTTMRAADYAAFLYAAAAEAAPQPQPVDSMLVDVRASAPGEGILLGDGLDGLEATVRDPMPEEVDDDELLRIMGVRTAAEEAATTAGEELPALVRQSGTVRVKGSQSELIVRYGSSVPPEARRPFEDSMRAWADTFPSKVPIRIDFDWNEIAFGTLAATTTPFFISGNQPDADELDNDTVYGSVMAASLQGMDFVSQDKAHIVMTFNSRASWHFGSDRTPSRKWDLRTTCLHEICHGLFFSGVVQARGSEREAAFLSSDNRPARFDRFLAAGNGAGLATTCTGDRGNFYNAITNSGLRFLDAQTQGVDFGLYSPFTYQGGSSTYHNDPARIEDDCVANGIPERDCSDLMTQKLPNGYTQRSIGEPVVRIMRSMRSRSRGVKSDASCNVKPGLPGQGDDGNPFGDIGIFQSDFNLPQWAIYTIIGMGVLGAAALIWALFSSLVRRK